MKRFLIDIYRIFLLQTSKVLWDIIGWTFLIWYVFYATYDDIGFNQLIFYTIIAATWLGIRLFYTRGRKKFEEVESLRPVMPFTKGISNILVLFLFFIFICGVTSFLYYDYRLAKFLLWFQDYFNTGADLTKEPYYKYIDLIKEITPETVITQKENIKNLMCGFLLYAVLAAVPARLKLIPRIIFIGIFLLITCLAYMNLQFINYNKTGLMYQLVSYSVYFSMVIYLIIPKQTNFK